MNNRWRGAAIVAALLLGAPAYGQDAGSQMGTGGQRSPGDDAARTTTGNQGTGTAGSERSGDAGSASGAQGTGSAGSETATMGRAGSQANLKGDLEEKIQEIHAGNQGEVQIAELGIQNAQSPEVKQYAQRLKEDHQKSDEQLQQLAQTMGVNLQGEEFREKQKEAREHLSDLQEKQGKEFDKEFMSHMVKDHKKDVKEVDKAAKEAREQNHTQLASFLETTRTKLQGHLDEAKRIERSLDQGSGQPRSGSRSGEMGTGSGASGTGATGTGSGAPEHGAPAGNTPTTGSGATEGTGIGTTGGSGSSSGGAGAGGDR